MKEENLTKKELENRCVEEKILLKRMDPITKSPFYVTNMEKISIMMREFDFLVEGAARGKAINEMSRIERHLHDNEKNMDILTHVLATNYTNVSIIVEEKMDMIQDRNSDNWNTLFTRYFSLQDIYDYFHKTESASSYFKRFAVFNEMVEITYNQKLLEYLESQVQLFLPKDDETDIPYQVDSLELKILVLHQAGFLETLKQKMKDHYYSSGARFLTTFLAKPPGMWKQISNILRDIDAHPEESILNDAMLISQLKDILFHYKADFRE
jgi:hypothetical protein